MKHLVFEAVVTVLLPVRIERFGDSVCRKNEDVSRVQCDSHGRVCGVFLNAQRQGPVAFTHDVFAGGSIPNRPRVTRQSKLSVWSVGVYQAARGGDETIAE